MQYLTFFTFCVTSSPSLKYLTKQVELLRQMNDQHARVYEQLDVAARDLEQSNHKLIQDGRLAQHKILRSVFNPTPKYILTLDNHFIIISNNIIMWIIICNTFDEVQDTRATFLLSLSV